MHTTHRMGQDGHCQQFDTTPTLISAPQWPHRPCNAPMRLYTVGKKPSVKADLAMYSHTVDVSRQYMSVSLILGCKLDFASCIIRAGFCKSYHILSLCTNVYLHMLMPGKEDKVYTKLATKRGVLMTLLFKIRQL